MFPQGADSARFRSLEPYDFHMQYLRNDPAVIIDVRTKMEYRHNRIKDAVNLPSSQDLSNYTDTLSRDYHLFLYCTTGYRSRRAAEFLYEKGFRNLYNLEGGITAWNKDGMPLEKRRPKRK
ncbi:MAG: rhodanese-like domain-containing protein [Bacteroidales bacterium]|nr:rhodanese-like domain-containing protein [Bacteroidales bacterium]